MTRKYTAKFPAQDKTVQLVDRLRRIEQMLSAKSGACVPDIAAEIETTEKQARRYLAMLRELGCVISTATGLNERAYWRCAKASRVFR